MNRTLLKIKCACPDLKLGDVFFNAKVIESEIEEASSKGIDLLVLPELCLCGYSLRDMLSSIAILDSCDKAIRGIIEKTRGSHVYVFVGTPLMYKDKIFNCAMCIQNGEILNITTKNVFDKKSPFGEIRVFDSCAEKMLDFAFGKNDVPVNSAFQLENVRVGCAVGKDYTGIENVEVDLIVNPTADVVTVTMQEDRKYIAEKISYEKNCAYASCNAGEYESTTDVLFASHNIISQKGNVLYKTRLFERKTTEDVYEIDLDSPMKASLPKRKEEKKSSPHPFILDDEKSMKERCEMILTIQAHALARRLESSYSKAMVVGISGGLDSTLALLAMVQCADYLGWNRKNIIAVTMPCFGTTQRTKSNAIDLCNELGVTLREINIFEATKIHLRDIGHDEAIKNVTYENAQARERTQILMDISNDVNGIVVGTGDLSEVALGWATYNGDHMAMYNVNSNIPKTLVRHVVGYFAKNCEEKVSKILLDILDTPVSPELLPAKDNGEIQQKTEDLVGPYDLHDYFLYNFVGYGYTPSQIYKRAKEAFLGIFDEETIYKWLKVFIKRFVTQQFKRSASPEGIMVGTFSLSPRGDFNMPSDMSYETLLAELEENR